MSDVHLHRLQESFRVSMVDSLGRSVPAGVVGVTSVRTSIDPRLIKVLDPLILKSFIDFKQFLRSRFLIDVAHRSNTWVPLGVLSGEEVTVNLFLYLLAETRHGGGPQRNPLRWPLCWLSL